MEKHKYSIYLKSFPDVQVCHSVQDFLTLFFVPLLVLIKQFKHTQKTSLSTDTNFFPWSVLKKKNILKQSLHSLALNDFNKHCVLFGYKRLPVPGSDCRGRAAMNFRSPLRAL